jgi:heme/copper-type cytochrome/quinol oxidase subunit 2
MKKIKYLMAAIAFTFIVGISSVSAQDQSANSSTTTTTNTATTPENEGWMNNPTALIVGGIGVLVLGVVIVMMVRNRRKTIGGMQNQDKEAPRQVTTQSINNPGSGV